MNLRTFYPIFVIPAKAGIQLIQAVLSRLGGTAFAGVTAFLTFYEIIILAQLIHLTSGTFFADSSDSNVFTGLNPITNPKMIPGNILNREL